MDLRATDGPSFFVYRQESRACAHTQRQRKNLLTIRRRTICEREPGRVTEHVVPVLKRFLDQVSVGNLNCVRGSLKFFKFKKVSIPLSLLPLRHHAQGSRAPSRIDFQRVAPVSCCFCVRLLDNQDLRNKMRVCTKRCSPIWRRLLPCSAVGQ